MGPGFERGQIVNNSSHFYTSDVSQSSEHAFDFRLYSTQQTSHDAFKPHQSVCWQDLVGPTFSQRNKI